MKSRQFVPGRDWIWYAPHTQDQYGELEIRAVTSALKRYWLTTGQITKTFEQRVARLFGKKHGLFVNSGSSANLLALGALNLPQGSEVITPACTFATTVTPLLHYKLAPVFTDVRLGSYTLDVDQLEGALSKKTRAIMVPHLIGNFADLPAIRQFAKKRDLVVIEDSCDTIGGLIKGKPSGAWSDIATTSFYASHIITSGGAGGMLMTNDHALLHRARLMRDWGRGISRHDERIRSRLASFTIDNKPYDSAFIFVTQGFNFRPTEMQAAFGLSQLARLPRAIAARDRNFKTLSAFFRQYEKYFILPEALPRTKTNWLAFPLTIRKEAPFARNRLMTYLEDHKIQTRPLFAGNILKHPAFHAIPHRQVGTLENANTILTQSFLIGVHQGITNEMLNYIFEVFDKFLKRKKSSQN